MPCPFTGPKMFCAGPNFLSQPKKLTAYSKPFVLAQKPILLNTNHLLVWHKKFGPAQNILEPVKGQGITVCSTLKICCPANNEDAIQTHMTATS